MLRIKNEEEKIYHCLASIHDVFDEIIIVDNGSEDRTPQVVRDFKAKLDKDDKIALYSYPFRLSRCGPEHFGTPEDSVHSLCYYYNWTLSKCSCSYVCKWDGDMVLRLEKRNAFKKFVQSLQRSVKMSWVLYGQTVYRDLQGNYYLAKDEINGEAMIFPAGLTPRFYKADLYEALTSDPRLDEGEFADIVFYELKFTNTNEFSHWSIDDIPTDRKKRELEHFRLVKAGNVSSAQFEKRPPSFLDDQISG